MANQLQMVLLGVALGILLIIIGIGASSEWVYLIGALITPLVLFWGGLFLKEESIPMRVAMVAVGGIIVAATVQCGGGLSYIF